MKNTSAQTSSSGAVSASRVYDAFGNLVSSFGQWQEPFGYAGNFGYQEDGSGLKLLGHRYYDPSTGRFITSDPLGYGSNWYAYAQGNPLTRVDPEGLEFFTAIIGTALLIIVIVKAVASGYVALNEFLAEQEYENFKDDARRDGELSEYVLAVLDGYDWQYRGGTAVRIATPIAQEGLEFVYGDPTRGISPQYPMKDTNLLQEDSETIVTTIEAGEAVVETFYNGQ